MTIVRCAALAASIVVTGTVAAPARAQGEGLVEFRILSLQTAQKAANVSLEACRKNGFQVSVAVVDRFGNLQVLLRDRFAGAHTPDTARRKAWTAVSFHTATTELASLTQPGQPQSAARDITDALMLGGGIMVQARGSVVGGIGVSGAPGGAADEDCARQGFDAIVPDIEF